MKEQKQEGRKPAFSKVAPKAAGLALHTSNHSVTVALSAWK